MRGVTAAEQEYLETLLHLDEAQEPMTAANVSRAMALSAPTVHEMIKRLESDGFIERDERKRISFTAEGLAVARDVASRHRLVERFLVDVLGIPWYEVHTEAARIDRSVSPMVLEKMREAIGTATTCPHGHPIAVGQRVRCGTRLADVPVGERITMLRFENEQDEIVRSLHAAGARLGLTGVVERNDDEAVVVESPEGLHTELSPRVAATVAVWASVSTPGPPANATPIAPR
ncbi:metal-dependent transcriptional regulator [Patulibacter sp. SYSU D01012]|uniref:metal-dependent transcriptional regulator n=1 Tax=Patulibacter sp. SYSU D01012 TaxID=2817381 RepID=UPI001B309ED3|nr:metal-dependent transcriptional regulator [Patulibacter sp. SYSU D01012]